MEEVVSLELTDDDVPITDIVMYGKGDMRLELYPGKLRLFSSYPCTVGRTQTHELTVNFHACRVIHMLQYTREGPCYARIDHIDATITLEGCRKFPSSNEAMKELLPRLEAEDDKDALRSLEWLISGKTLAINLVNRRTEGELLLFNRSFSDRSIRLGAASKHQHLKLSPYERHRVVPCCNTFLHGHSCMPFWDEVGITRDFFGKINYDDPLVVKSKHAEYAGIIDKSPVPIHNMHPDFILNYQRLDRRMKELSAIALASCKESMIIYSVKYPLEYTTKGSTTG